jgi:hypothetical protein
MQYTIGFGIPIFEDGFISSIMCHQHELIIKHQCLLADVVLICSQSHLLFEIHIRLFA